MEAVTERPTVSVEKACVLVGVSKRTLYNWMADAKVDWFDGPNGMRRVYEDSLWRQDDWEPYPKESIKPDDPAKLETVSIITAMIVVSVHRRTIYNWIRDNKVIYVRTAGGSIRIVASSLWKDQQTQASTRGQAARAVANA